MIDHKVPKDWKDLQSKVAQIFTDIGYKTEIGKDIQTVRGIVNVDVFSVDESQSPDIVYLCECKHWEKRIPKTIVHAFRTVVQDFGANYGIIISKKGFQKGAHVAARNTNIKLVDWFGFQNMFEEKWLPAISQKIYNKYEALVDYTEPLIGSRLARKLDQLDENEVEKFKVLRRRYTIFGAHILNLRFGRPFFRKQKIELPIFLEIPTDEQNKFEKKKLSSLREYINCLVMYSEKGMKEFGELFKKNI